jgi:hypothetical protein
LTVVTGLLVLATVLLVIASVANVRWTSVDVRHKLRALVSLVPLRITGDSWTHVGLETRIINTGLSYITVTSAVLFWLPRLLSSETGLEISDQALPILLAPRESISFRFTIPEAALEHYRHQLFESPMGFFGGMVTCRVVGQDGKEMMVSRNLPGLAHAAKHLLK